VFSSLKQVFPPTFFCTCQVVFSLFYPIWRVQPSPQVTFFFPPWFFPIHSLSIGIFSPIIRCPPFLHDNPSCFGPPYGLPPFTSPSALPNRYMLFFPPFFFFSFQGKHILSFFYWVMDALSLHMISSMDSCPFPPPWIQNSSADESPSFHHLQHEWAFLTLIDWPFLDLNPPWTFAHPSQVEWVFLKELFPPKGTRSMCLDLRLFTKSLFFHLLLRKPPWVVSYVGASQADNHSFCSFLWGYILPTFLVIWMGPSTFFLMKSLV